MFAVMTFVASTAFADSPVLHEPIGADPHEDLALEATVDGDIPAAIRTPSGLVPAPNPRRDVDPADPRYGASDTGRDLPPSPEFVPDRDTRRPDVMPYDEPFSPSIAPFKRLVAYDTVTKNFSLGVGETRMEEVPLLNTAKQDASEDHFFADLVLDVAPGKRVRIPTVGPGTRVLHARLAVGVDEVPFTIVMDGAENWFVLGRRAARARLVMELVVPRSAFGGVFQHAEWTTLPATPPLPQNVRDVALSVASQIGVSRQMSPSDAVTKLVAYFRSFADSNDPPRDNGLVYVDLALSKKGVCRHRAYAFMVTALALGIPTRMVINEAHAWVEVHDGTSFRIVDLGGAGRLARPPQGDNARYQPPQDVFAWPAGATRGDDLARETEGTSGGANASPKPSPSSPGNPGVPAAVPGASASGVPSASPSSGRDPFAPPSPENDARPASSVTVAATAKRTKRGTAMEISGAVVAGGKPCPRVVVEVFLHARGAGADHARDRSLGSVATDSDGNYRGSMVVPSQTPVGSYDVVTRTRGDTRCGFGTGG
ncbi:MAG: transglutaminase domain-containing protein [Polyangiaceae bacterium]